MEAQRFMASRWGAGLEHRYIAKEPFTCAKRTKERNVSEEQANCSGQRSDSAEHKRGRDEGFCGRGIRDEREANRNSDECETDQPRLPTRGKWCEWRLVGHLQLVGLALLSNPVF